MTKRDYLVHGIAAGGTIRCMAAQTTILANEACQRHATAPTAAAALGRTLTGSLLIGCGMKDLEKITVRFQCEGELGGITAEADAHGNIRGYVRNPAAHLPPKPNGKLDVSGVVGTGMLYVIREAGFEIGLRRDPYVGSVPIVSGEVAEDLAYYLTKSEQIPSAVSLGVYLEPEPYRVTAAGGFIIQVLPGAEPAIIAQIERAVQQSPASTELIRAGCEPAEMLLQVLGELDLQILEEKPVQFHCHCSYERAVNIISCLGREEVTDMIEKDQGAELTCHFCSEVYNLDEAVLQQILADYEPVN